MSGEARIFRCRECGRKNMTRFVQRTHECTPSFPPTMANQKNVSALSVIASSELRADASQLALLQASAIEQFKRLRALRGEESTRGLLLGLQLSRIRHSLPHGEWGKWIAAHSTLSDRWVNYLMRLSLVFIDKAKATKPELLACPGDQTELTLEAMQGEQRRFVEKVLKFVGDLSLSELMEKHGLKETKQLGGMRSNSAAATAEPEAPATPDQLAAAVRDEVGGAIERLEILILRECRLAHVAGDHVFLRGVAHSLGELALKGDERIRELLALSGDVAAQRSMQPAITV